MKNKIFVISSVILFFNFLSLLPLSFKYNFWCFNLKINYKNYIFIELLDNFLIKNTSFLELFSYFFMIFNIVMMIKLRNKKLWFIILCGLNLIIIYFNFSILWHIFTTKFFIG
jgi:hypothetical protein